MKQWYVVNTKPHCETFAQANLQRLGVEVFLPMIREQKAIRSHRHEALAPLFPGYLFARFEITSQFRAVSYARGVRQIVSFGAGPSIVDEAIIDSIREQAMDGVVEVSEKDFAPGQVVRIHEGRLFGLEAIFEKKMSGTHRAVVLLKAISYQARVILESKYIVNL